MKNRRMNGDLTQMDWRDVWVVPLLTGFLTIGLFLWNSMAGVIGVLVTGFLGYYTFVREKQAADRTKQAIEALNEDFDEVTKNAVFGMPFPMAVLNAAGNFLWYNSRFKALFHIEETFLGKSYRDVFATVSIDTLLQKTNVPFAVQMDGKTFQFYHNCTDGENHERLLLLYGVDDTENEAVRQAWREQKPVVLSIHLDNYDDLRTNTAEADRPMLFAEIDRKLNAFANTYEALLVKYETDRYLVVMDALSFASVERDRFPVMEEVRRIRMGNDIDPTLSLGVAYGDRTPADLLTDARAAIDIALSRGGSQAVMKEGDNLRYFGGKNQATERHTSVRARVISHAVSKMVEEASEVFIMGHTNPDMDSYGACLGMLAFVQKKETRGYIVLDGISPAIEHLYKKSLKELPMLLEMLKDPSQAVELYKPSSLVIVVDNHRFHSTACPELVEKAEKVIIIDHHRRGRDFIQKATISYIEPSASSASEMITEMLGYLDEKIKLPSVVVEGLLAGITVDTKNFFYQTGARTFDAAAFLKRHGADSIVVKQLFKDDADLVRYRSEVIAQAEEFEHHTIIGRFDRNLEGSTLIASQAADDLLNIRGIDASFVLTRVNGQIHISARSLGEVSVQIIMEKLGGGGHLTASATQLACPMDEAEEQLKEAIRAYFKEEE